MPIIENQKISSRVMKRVIIVICFLLMALAGVFFLRHYHAALKVPPQDTKQAPLSEEPTSTRQHHLQKADRQFLIAHGLQDPASDLVQDLMKHNELIPCKGVVGGTPGFYNPTGIAVLSKNQVIADYDDGHVEGTVKLKFTVSNGTISWTVTQAECGD